MIKSRSSLGEKTFADIFVREMGQVLKFPWIKEDVSRHVQTKNHVSGLLRTYVFSGASTVLSLPYPTTDCDSPTRAKLIKRSTKVLQRLNETLKNADFHENFCACSKLFFWTSVLLRSPTITAFTSFHTKLFWRNSSDHGRLPTFPLTSENVDQNVMVARGLKVETDRYRSLRER